ncbi:serine/threonine-protein kinase CTR1 [Vigna unguiculata]|uniref:Serine/threonine-protein kinase CTR1 n=1 Tax=Vigna unguiculata TaxID=3917 RepID=A0A4D6NFD6_VIGUN|nr:serine/threonine-protein kinase CTR1 [Vigna unguiculata]
MLGTNTGKDPSMFPQHAQQDLSSSVSNTGRHVQNNITMLAGEEFYANVGRDGIAAGKVLVSPDIPRNHENVFGLNRENRNVRYEDLTNILGLRRMDSQNSSDISDFVSLKQSVQEMENGASVNISNKIQKGDGMLRKAVQEPVGDQSGLAVVSPLCRYEASQSNVFSGSGVVDDFLSGKVKFLCSFGGKILPRPSDGKLRYVGGDTHIISIPKDISWQELMKKTLGICNQPHTIKYQLPGEDLDALISVSSDEDLQNMKEEYHGLERHERSQKLRIFLVPLCESEETSSTEVSAVQQSDPDYQYVVAVNGMGDSTRTNIGGQNLTNESSQLGTDLNFTPVLQKTPNASPLEIRDGINALNPDGLFNDSLSLQRPLSIPPAPIPVAGSNTGYIQLLGDHSCQGSIESNASYATTKLHPEYSNIRTIGCIYPQHVSDTCSYQGGDVGQPKKLNGGHLDYNPSKELVTPVYVNPRDEFFGGRSLQRERVYSKTPLSFLDDVICQQGESYGTTDSPHGIPHAFSDPQLLETGARSDCCSQNGYGQSFSLNLEKGQISSLLIPSVSRVNVMEHQHDSFVHHPHIQSTTPKEESAHAPKRQDLTSPYYESMGMNNLVHMDNTLAERKNSIAQTDLGIPSYDAKDVKENSVKLERMKIIEQKNCIPKDSNGQQGKSFAIDKRFVAELHLLDSFPANNLNADINTQKNRDLPFEGIVPIPSDTMDLSLNNYAEKTTCDSNMSERTSEHKINALAKGLNGEQGFDFSWTRNFDLNAPILNSEVGSSDKSSRGDHTYKLTIHPASHKAAQIHPSKNHMAIAFQENPTICYGSLYPAAFCDELDPSVNMPMNDPDNSSNIMPLKKAPPLHDDFITSTGQMVDQFIPKHSASGMSNVEDKVSEQQNILEGYTNVNQVESFNVADMTRVVHPYIFSNIGSVVISPSHTEAGSIIPESEPEDFNEDKNELFSDAMIAEMEASNYGLQIIRNADLEELTELGSGTYGTVYHGKWRGTDIAIKRIKKSCFAGRSSEQERLAKDFWREAQILSNLHHPNVVAFYGIVPDGAEGTLATVTEYMVNGSLRHVLVKNNRLLDRRKKLIIAMDAAFGMEYLHSKNIVHFDLKCDNLLVNLRDPQRPICKVGDFGLSRIKRNTLVSGGVRGTLPWMAPELLNGNSSRVSEKVDVFSFGISMWELLTGEEPYADMHCGAIIGGIVKNTLRPPVPERCDSGWRKLMEECWSPDPESRPSFTEITSRLRSMSLLLQTKGNYQLRPF